LLFEVAVPLRVIQVINEAQIGTLDDFKTVRLKKEGLLGLLIERYLLRSNKF